MQPEMFSMGREQAWMFRRREKKSAETESISRKLTNRSTSTGPWESGLRVNKITSWRLQAVDTG
jgi:hypothetical protein